MRGGGKEGSIGKFPPSDGSGGDGGDGGGVGTGSESFCIGLCESLISVCAGPDGGGDTTGSTNNCINTGVSLIDG
jgi:hypothetical protein